MVNVRQDVIYQIIRFLATYWYQILGNFDRDDRGVEKSSLYDSMKLGFDTRKWMEMVKHVGKLFSKIEVWEIRCASLDCRFRTQQKSFLILSWARLRFVGQLLKHHQTIEMIRRLRFHR